MSNRLFVTALPNGGLILVIFEVYVDESYDRDASKVVAVAGYLIEKTKAVFMERSWKYVLKKYNLPYFHMVEAAHGNKNFDGMPKDKRSKVVRSMMKLIDKYVSYGFVFAVPPSKILDRKGSAYDPYALVVSNLLLLCQAMLNTEIPGESFTLILESGHGTAQLARKKIAENQAKGLVPKLSSYVFATKTERPLLQAADLLAWQAAKNIKDKVFEGRSPRGDFKALTASKHTFFYFYSESDRAMVIFDVNPHLPDNIRDNQIKQVFGGEELADRALKSWSEKDFSDETPRSYIWHESVGNSVTKK